MKYLLGVDFGGGASKATLLNTEGTIVAEIADVFKCSVEEIEQFLK